MQRVNKMFYYGLMAVAIGGAFVVYKARESKLFNSLIDEKKLPSFFSFLKNESK